MSQLFIVGTPIGNLGDISLRALETLKSVDAIACEDTRHTLALLTHFGIRKPLLSCHANDEARGAARIVGLLGQGKNVAYCSDAGTPGLSDPGSVLAAAARAAGHSVVPIPGPSAFAALMSVAGFGGRSVLFDGFPSPKASRRQARLKELLSRGEAFVLYESPFRIGKLVREIAGIEPGRIVCLGRELTKIHEQVVVATASEAAEKIGSGAIPEKGEFTILVSSATGDGEKSGDPGRGRGEGEERP